MKKVILLAAVITMSLSSCKKDYNCECTTTSSAGTTTTTEKTGKMSLSDATTKCNEGDDSDTVFGVTTETECSIK